MNQRLFPDIFFPTEYLINHLIIRRYINSMIEDIVSLHSALSSDFSALLIM
jgi:hypothetical protein